MILFCIGYGLLAQNWLSLVVAIVLPTAGTALHEFTIEEAAMAQGIGTEYQQYQKETKKLIPVIW